MKLLISALFRARSVRVALVLMTAGGLESAVAQPASAPRPDAWRTDGPVRVLLPAGNIAYVGGSFDYVGPYSGALGAVTASDGRISGTTPLIAGSVLSVAPDGVGGFYVGGEFTVPGTTRSNLIHVLSNRQLDPAWSPSVSGIVRTLLVTNGSVYLGGDFIKVNGLTRNRLAQLSVATGDVGPWNPNAGAGVYTMVLNGDTLYLGGAFNTLGAQTRTRIGAVALSTGATLSFNPGTAGSGNLVRALALNGSTLYVGGEYTTIGGKPRNRLASLDTTLNTANATDWNPNALDDVQCIAISGDRIYVGGNFTTVGSVARGRIAVLTANSNQALAGWNPEANGAVSQIVPTPDGLYVAGAFTAIGGANRNGIARLNADTGLIQDWAPNVSTLSPTTSPDIRSITLAGTDVFLGGVFSSCGGVARGNLFALDLATGRPTAWDPDANGDVVSFALADSLLYVGGRFTTIGGAARTRLAALDRTTGNATSFSVPVTAAASGGVYALRFNSTRLYVAGSFTAVGGVNRANLAEVNTSEGTVTPSWNPAPNSSVWCLGLVGTNLYAGGGFTTIGGSNRVGFAAVSTQGTGRSTGFLPRTDNDVYAMAFNDSNQIIIGGDFGNAGGQARRRLALIDRTTGDAAAWNPDIGTTGTLQLLSTSITPHSILIGGQFGSAGGEFRNRAAAIDSVAGTANAWNPNANNIVREVSYTSGVILVGGDFTAMGSTPSQYLALFDTAPSILSKDMTLTPAGNVTFTVWDGETSGTELVIQGKTNLPDAAWTDLVSRPLSGKPFIYEDTATAGTPRRFYRALVR